MKQIFAFWLMYCICCLLSITGMAQSGTWVWVNGSDTLNSPGNYGNQGAPSVNNSPPALYQAAQWTDKQGHFWIFGGLDNSNMEHGDLWEYDPVANTWTWVKGSGMPNSGAVYGNKGVPSINNIPGTRSWGCTSWTDNNGDLWLFGGLGYDTLLMFGDLGDLWRYHIATNEWTWMDGPSSCNQVGVYGALYQSSDTSLPPPRHEANTGWTDAQNNLWLFGGYAFGGDYNDLWRYNITSAQWTWMGGSNQENNPGNYGVMGVENTTNTPAARSSYTHWINGNYLYLSGGGSFVTNSVFSDVWRFNMNTNNWAWIGGDSGIVTTGQYINFCSTNGGNEPMGRIEQRSAQLNGCASTLFMFGGVTTINWMAVLNDLWSFDLATQNWKWISGSDTLSPYGSYGTMGVSSTSNMPPGMCGACFWSDSSGNLWLWGGLSNYEEDLNAMWKYIPDGTCVAVDSSGSISYTLMPGAICPGSSALISFSNGSGISITPVTYVTWIDSLNAELKPDTTTTFTLSGYSVCGDLSVQSFVLPVLKDSISITCSKTLLCPGDSTEICAASGLAAYSWNNGDTTSCITTPFAGNYYVIVTGIGNCSATSNQINISIYQPAPVTISISGDTLSAYSANSYQWLLNGVPITGANSSVYVAATSGTYTLQVTDTNGCTANSTPVLISGITSVLAESSIKIFPNPSSGNWQLSVGSELISSTAEVYDATGRIVFKSEIRNPQSEITIPNAASGIYELRIVSNDFSVVRKLVKM